jgi:hypothetical protein
MKHMGSRGQADEQKHIPAPRTAAFALSSVLEKQYPAMGGKEVAAVQKAFSGHGGRTRHGQG